MTTLREDIASDLATIFEDWDTITWPGHSIKGIFHEPFELVTLFGVDIESKDPFIEVADSDISGLINGTSLTVNGVTYKLISIQPTGFGKTVVQLSKD